MSAEIAKNMELPVERYPAQWDKFGRSAGPIRNTQMLTEGKPHGVVAFHYCLAKSKGTRNMVEQAKRKGIPTWTFEDGAYKILNLIIEILNSENDLFKDGV
jgi:hypothetical protein